eukprot:4773945-Pyramimonas_sp.AAC.1
MLMGGASATATTDHASYFIGVVMLRVPSSGSLPASGTTGAQPTATAALDLSSFDWVKTVLIRNTPLFVAIRGS